MRRDSEAGVFEGLVPTYADKTQLDFLRKQVVNSRNVRSGRRVDFTLGRLNHPVEHHLVASMPRVNLRRAQPLVVGLRRARGRLRPV